MKISVSAINDLDTNIHEKEEYYTSHPYLMVDPNLDFSQLGPYVDLNWAKLSIGPKIYRYSNLHHQQNHEC